MNHKFDFYMLCIAGLYPLLAVMKITPSTRYYYHLDCRSFTVHKTCLKKFFSLLQMTFKLTHKNESEFEANINKLSHNGAKSDVVAFELFKVIKIS